jgi:hypothetical protein
MLSPTAPHELQRGGGPFLPGQRYEELAGGRAAVTPGSWAATPAAIGSFRINPLNWWITLLVNHGRGAKVRRVVSSFGYLIKM